MGDDARVELVGIYDVAGEHEVLIVARGGLDQVLVSALTTGGRHSLVVQLTPMSTLLYTEAVRASSQNVTGRT
jgi:hypothetical protein